METDIALSKSLDRKRRRDWIEASIELGSRFVLEWTYLWVKTQEGEEMTDEQDAWKEEDEEAAVMGHFSDRM